jgi:glycosyltransferase involved in cell wall biosynthesis
MPSANVSTITPSFNQARFLPATLASVAAQDYPAIEHLVIDGGSTDGSVEILRAARGITWVSEPDHGQVDALNKGFAMARGEILAWLNSDDTINRDCVRLAVETLERTGADLVYGDLDIVDEDGKLLRPFRGIPFDLPILLYGINYIGQQTTFFRRSLLEKAGPLRPEFDNAFDYELWLRMARHGRLVYDPRLRGQIRKHPAAKSIAADSRTHQDTERIRADYWADGGLPDWMRHRPWFKAVNLWYRLRRRRKIKPEAGSSKPEVGNRSR